MSGYGGPPLDSLDDTSTPDQTVQDTGPTAVSSECILNEKFQNIVEDPSKARDAQTLINELSQELIIDNIDEVISKHAPGFKSVFKGIAGGDKQAGNQLFIKICTVHPEGTTLCYDSYSHAGKVAGHELKGLAAILSCNQVNGFRAPLMCTIDYKGKRMLVMTRVPLTNEGVEGDETINKSLQELAQMLNLRKHKSHIKGEDKESYFPFDFEIRKGSDGRLYAIDLSRVIPHEVSDGRLGYLFRLFRPEFVRHFLPLSPDAFAPCCDADVESKAEIALIATKHLQHSKVPETANIFTNEDQKDAATLKKFLHDHGVNLRYLALFLWHLCERKPEIKVNVVQVEMVARAFAHMLNETLRYEFMTSQHLVEGCLKIANDILDCYPDKVMEPKHEWMKVGLRDQFKNMYELHLIPSTAAEETSKMLDNGKYWGGVIQEHRIAIIQRVSEMTGVIWDPQELIAAQGERKIMSTSDGLKYERVVKTITIQPTAEVYRAKGNFTSAIACYEAELQWRQHFLGKDHLRVAILKIYLAEVCCELDTKTRRHTAIESYNDAFRIYIKHLETAANVLDEAKKVNKGLIESKEKFQQAVAAADRWVVELNLSFALAIERQVMGMLRFDKKPDFGHIAKLLEKCVELKQIVDNKNEIVKTLHLQAWASYHSSDYKSAEQKLTNCLSLLGNNTDNNVFKAVVLTNLGLVYLKQNNIAKGQALCEEALSMLRKERPWTFIRNIISSTEDNLGKTYLRAWVEEHGQKTDMLERANEHFQTGKGIREEILGEHHLTSMSMDHIAQVQLQTGLNPESFKIYTDTLPTLRRQLGSKHYAVGILLHNIAVWYAYNNDISKALEAQREAVYILSTAFGPNHKLVSDAQNALKTYESKEKKEVLQMSHDRIVTPNQRDLCPIADQEESNNNESVPNENKDNQTFKNLLSAACGIPSDVTKGLISLVATYIEASSKDNARKAKATGASQPSETTKQSNDQRRPPKFVF